ncbi:hypothetical protein CWO90_05385 [Bradyrhizobium sp. Leo121]|nr:hypothetical protein CWO90_05385 [Bradyrhizobium sp. Leo121]
MRGACCRNLLLDPLNLELRPAAKLTVQKAARLSGRYLLNDQQPLLQHFGKRRRIITHESVST